MPDPPLTLPPGPVARAPYRAVPFTPGPRETPRPALPKPALSAPKNVLPAAPCGQFVRATQNTEGRASGAGVHHTAAHEPPTLVGGANGQAVTASRRAP